MVFPSEKPCRKWPGRKNFFKEVSMSEDWEGAYLAAVTETDQRKLMGKIDSAIAVLRACLLELGSSPKEDGETERIADALQTLEVIRRTELQIPV
jgi:hypothetical protein